MINNEKSNETITISLDEYNKLKTLKEHCSELENKVNWLMEQLKINNKKTYGSKSEQTEYVCEQLSLLYNEAELYSDIEEKEDIEISSHTRKRKTSTFDKLPEDLKTVVVEHTLPEDEQFCGTCGSNLEIIGKEVKQTLKFKPAEVYIQEDVYYTYACKNCEKNDIETPIIKVPQMHPVIKGSFASAEAIAHIMTQKFVMYSPLYRQEQDLKRQGIELSRQTMSNWLLKATELWLEPIYEKLRGLLVKEEIIHADETTLKVLELKKNAPTAKEYMWLYRTSGCSKKQIVLYDYKPNRKPENAENFLKGFNGYMHTDGYSGYHSLGEKFKIVGCMAHCRRKFVEAAEIHKKDKRNGTTAARGIDFCNRLYAIEKQISKKKPEDKKKTRQEEAKPILDAFFSWVKTIENVSTKSKLGEALNYTKNNEKYLRRYIEDGRLEIDNNRAERSIKPFVMGRKNFLFANTESGAQGSAIIYSIIETAKENNLDPFKYLVYIFNKAPNLKDGETIEIMLPWNVPEHCKSKATKSKKAPQVSV